MYQKENASENLKFLCIEKRLIKILVSKNCHEQTMEICKLVMAVITQKYIQCMWNFTDTFVNS